MSEPALPQHAGELMLQLDQLTTQITQQLNTDPDNAVATLAEFTIRAVTLAATAIGKLEYEVAAKLSD